MTVRLLRDVSMDLMIGELARELTPRTYLNINHEFFNEFQE